jgi:hypothetical protein
MRSPPWLLLSVLGFLLGCAGACADFSEGVQQGFGEGFDESFRPSFVDSCAEGTGPDDPMRRACACAADELLARHTITELITITSDVEDPANVAIITDVMKGCMVKNGMAVDP